MLPARPQPTPPDVTETHTVRPVAQPVRSLPPPDPGLYRVPPWAERDD